MTMGTETKSTIGGTTSTNRNPTKGQRVIVVADPNRESAGALQYALSHATKDDDELILLHVRNKKGSISSVFRRHLELVSNAASDIASPEGGHGGIAGIFGDGSDFLEDMKVVCEKANPRLSVRIDKVDQGAMDKGTTILFRSRYLSVDLLLIGQRRSFSNVLLGMTRQRRNGGALPLLPSPMPMVRGPKPTLGGPRAIDTAEFLIDNSYCNCVGVQKKGQKAGYVLNTKTRKNYWLLA